MTAQTTSAPAPAQAHFGELVAVGHRMIARAETAHQRAQEAAEAAAQREGEPRAPGAHTLWANYCAAVEHRLQESARDLDQQQQWLSRLQAHPPQPFTVEELHAARSVTTVNGRQYSLVAVTETGVTVQQGEDRKMSLDMGEVYGVIS